MHCYSSGNVNTIGFTFDNSRNIVNLNANGQIEACAFRQYDDSKNYVDLITGSNVNFGVGGTQGVVYDLSKIGANTLDTFIYPSYGSVHKNVVRFPKMIVFTANIFTTNSAKSFAEGGSMAISISPSDCGLSSFDGNTIWWGGGGDYVATAVGCSTHYNGPFTFELRRADANTLVIYSKNSITMPQYNMLTITFHIPLK